MKGIRGWTKDDFLNAPVILKEEIDKKGWILTFLKLSDKKTLFLIPTQFTQNIINIGNTI